MEVLKITRKSNTPLQNAKNYLAAITSLNGIFLTPGELDLISFMAVRGTISTPPTRQAYMELYKKSPHMLKNNISSLSKKGLLQKINNKTRLHKALQLDFSLPSQQILLTLNVENDK